MSSTKDVFEWQQAVDSHKEGSVNFAPPKRFIRRGRLFKIIERQHMDFLRLNEIVKLVDYDDDDGTQPMFVLSDGSYPDEEHQMHWTEVIPYVK